MFIVLGTFVKSQQLQPQVVATTGNSSQQNNVHISYTVGEAVIQTLSTTDNTLTQGFQQPHYNITIIPQQNDLPYSIHVYPNPAKDELIIDVQTDVNSKFSMSLFDMSGKCLNVQEIIPNQQPKITLPMQQLADGKYLLHISDNKQHQTKTFEIIKTK